MSGTSETVEPPRAAVTTTERVDSKRHRAGLNPIAWLTAAVAILIVVIVAVAGIAYGRSTKGTTATITVTGSGTVQGTPDTVSFNVGVHTIRASAAAALDANDRRVKALENSLIRYGVPTKDLQTSGLSIYEQTDSSGNITGFSVDDNLNVTVTNTTSSASVLDAKAGTIIDVAAKQAGRGINFGGVTFSISNESSYLMSARARAMHSAMAAASQLASGANRSVTGIVRVTDQESTQQQSPYPFFGYAAALNSRSVPIQVGRQPVNVQVTVVYTIG